MDMALNPNANLTASLAAKSGLLLSSSFNNIYRFECRRRPEGCECTGCENYRHVDPESISDIAYAVLVRCENSTVAWVEEIHNIVTTEGKNDQLAQYFKGSSYTAAFFIGLVNNAGFTAYAVGDTAAQINGSNGWAEGTPYSNSTRVAWVGGTASGGSIDNSGSVATFSINATQTVRGGFVATASAKNATTGKLYGAVDFSATRSVVSGDSLLVTASFTLV